MTNHLFELAGNRKTETVIPKSKKKWYQGKPVVSAAILILIVLGCLCAELIMTKDPAYMDLLNYNKAPDREFLLEQIFFLSVRRSRSLWQQQRSARIYG